ncbi:MBL fold metallo-hydrolase [Roseivirga sp. UBA838]|uniref:MBL fold metallo-hydrolase n=1 Tax=Roseivirga sp. UBA838 TaxID=1947393 RepID=UPI00257B5497|nr:MBL fold metallo-hydrolase [Roseivirga sp. UBA838]|tara:strand:+ start:54464 stop:55234 length:771 start_codon:yes stop_codon:yes gene_type:complete
MSSCLNYTFLGQVCFLFSYEGLRWIIDPYFTSFVEEQYGEKFVRTFIFDEKKIDVSDLEYCLITHAHEDHCDPKSLAILLEQNPNMKIICDWKSAEIIGQSFPGLTPIVPKIGDKICLSENVSILTIPSAHTELNIEDGLSEFNGYIMQVGTNRLYHPGDTIPNREIESFLTSDIEIGFMPVNERNFFREELGIIGNMTLREAFQWSQELGIKTMIPTHWDMFALNGTTPEEIVLIKKEYHQVELKLPILYKKEEL